MDIADGFTADVAQLSIENQRHLHEGAEQSLSTIDCKPESRLPMTRDITTAFNSAASALKTGQLVQDASLTLFDAVGALEIMDPKMDSGYLMEGETLDDDYDVLRELLPEEVVGIMDQLLCFEMAWHMGYPLSQTLFTSLYIDRLLWPEPKTLEQARFDRDNTHKKKNQLLHVVLRAYCLALIKACDFVHNRISTEHYYEEEDFVSNLYNRRLLSDFSVNDINEILNSAITYSLVELPGPLEGLRQNIVIRLQLRKYLLAAVTLDDILDKQRAVQWDSALGLLPALSQTSKQGTPVESSFSIKLQRKLASSVPPRPILDIKLEDAFNFLGRLCQNGKDVYRVMDYHGGSHLQNFVWSFQSRSPQPSVYIRSLLQSLIFSDSKMLANFSFEQVMLDDLEEIVLPADVLVDQTNSDAEAPQDPRFQIAQRMNDFILRAANAFIDIFRTLCMNRSRLRRMLCHLVLEWDGIQFEAEGFDIELRRHTDEEPIRDETNSDEEIWSFPLSSWAYYHKLRQIEWIVQMGFELHMYQTDELAGMYWYLQHLARTRIQHLERIRTFTTRKLMRISAPTQSQKLAFRRSLNFLDFAMLEASATQSFADGLSCLYSFLAHLDLIPAPYHAVPYSTPVLRYSLRMRPFLSMALPEVPSYTEFTALVSLRSPEKNSPASSAPSAADTNEQAISILEVADQALKAARKDWEAISKASAKTARCLGCEDWWRISVRDVLRSCITANITVATAKTAVANAGPKNAVDRLKVELTENGQGYHAWWLVPKISTR